MLLQVIHENNFETQRSLRDEEKHHSSGVEFY